MKVLAAFLIGVLSVLLPALCLWGVWLAGVGFNNPVWIPVSLFPVAGMIAALAVAKGGL